MSQETRICRLCDENNDQMYNIFEKNIFDIQIINMIKDCLPILIYRTDPLSKYICHSCNENLNMFCEFKKSCLEIAKKHRDELEVQLLEVNEPAIELYLRQFEESSESVKDGPRSMIEDTPEESQESQSSIELIETHSAPILINDDTIHSSGDQTAESDMDIDDTVPHDNSITLTQAYLPVGPAITQKPRITGPKSVTNTYTKLIETDELVFCPLSLLESVVYFYNKQHIPDFKQPTWKETIRTIDKLNYCCRYCEEMFEIEGKLAVHELLHHVRLNLEKVDNVKAGSNLDQEEQDVRNKWIQMSKVQKEQELLEKRAEIVKEIPEKPKVAEKTTEIPDVDPESVEENLLVPIEKDTEKKEDELKPQIDISRNSKVYYVGEEAYAEGVPLLDFPKDVRNTFYQSCKFLGNKRKFCQLCRCTFKDNWSIEYHYTSLACYFSCNYCGQKFKRTRHEFPAHIKYHEDKGDEKSLKVFGGNEIRGDVRVYEASMLEYYVPLTYGGAQATPARVLRPPPPKPTPMKLRMRMVTPKIEPEDVKPEVRPQRSSLPPLPPPPAHLYDKPIRAVRQQVAPQMPQLIPTTLTSSDPKLMSNEELAKNQAYFCKKCYQVFTKLDNYNKHIKSCNGEIDDPEMSLIRHYNKKDGSSPLFCSKVKPPNVYKRNYKRNSMPDLRPLPVTNSAKKVKIKKEADAAPPEDFPCAQCSSVFQTVYSRNSHMRIHARERQAANSPSTSLKRSHDSRNSPNSNSHAKKVKQQANYEPIVEIHEGVQQLSSPRPRGSVSITPLKKSALNVSADIMRLVQNNPNITLKPREREKFQEDKAESGDEADPVKGGYKCSSCDLHFGNKSNLYFHKKNQCTGSRYPCPFCKKRFGTAAEYSSHIFYSHPE